MNKIENNIGNTIPSYAPGSLWKDSAGVIYILAIVVTGRPDKFNCISLADGTCWNSDPTNAKDTVSGLIFLAESATITVSPKVN